MSEYAPVVEPYGVNSATEHYARLLLLTGDRRRVSQTVPAVGEVVRRNRHRGRGLSAGVRLLGSVRNRASSRENRRWGEQAVAASRTPLYLFALGAANYRAGQLRAGRRVSGGIQCEVGHPADRSQPVSPGAWPITGSVNRRRAGSGTRSASRCCEVGRRRGSEDPPAACWQPLGQWRPSEWTHLNLMHREAKALLGLTEEPAPQTDKPVP